MPGLLLREPNAPPEHLEALLVAARGIPFVAVHERSLMGRAAPAGAIVHRASRPALGAVSARTGVSCHSELEVDAALGAGALYVLLSPIWGPTSKPGDHRTPLGVERFLEVAHGRNVLALGGVNPERFARLRGAGASAAVMGDLFGQVDPAAAVRRLRAYGAG